MDKEFEQRIKKELGEGMNPAYVESVLNRDIPGVFTWMYDNLQDMKPEVLETIRHADKYQDSEGKTSKSTLLLGTKLLEGQFKIHLFVLKEIRSRINAIDISPEI